jgi:hypothetical protein
MRKILIPKTTERERSLGRPRIEWKDNIKIDIREIVDDGLDSVNFSGQNFF